MMRFALGVEYDGSAFHGWQRQPGLRTVQGSIEAVLSKIANHDVNVSCAGRTDTGVHALNQVIHFDTRSERSQKTWIFGVNSQLPKDVCIRWVSLVNEDFHARFSAISRTYRYIICNNSIRPAVARGNVSWHYRRLNADLMQKASQCLIGEHDFSSFQASECQSKSPFRNITDISIKRQGDYILIDISANAFLHHMVRNIVGVLMQVGNEKKEVSWVAELLEAKDRTKAAETAPPYGLYLKHITYPEEFKLPTSKLDNLVCHL